ncbi:MAG TPA: sigma 54-interacting transcriptional regulator [Candidatus Saccharimonadales bacterium]|nr:sigma 54-interacting transcriptional regulator [Candidatus Saccharimonadales bacterium]
MNTFLTLFQEYIDLSSNPSLIIPIQLVSFIILAKIIANFTILRFSQKKFAYEKTLFVFFIIPIAAIMIDNIFLITKFIIPKTPLCRTINCIAWIFSCMKFHSLILFLEQLIHKRIMWNWYHKLFLAVESLLSIGFILSTIHLILYNEPFHVVIILFYAITLFSFVSVVATIVKQLSNQNIPLVLKQQLKTLLLYFLCPHFICILLELMPIIFFNKTRIVAFSNLGTILITASLYFCFKKIMQFRFLNLSEHVQTKPNFNLSTDFKDAMEQINVAENENEIEHIVQNFFQEQFLISKSRVTTYIRSKNDLASNTQQSIENFLNSDVATCNPTELFIKHKILVRHEIEFDEFYTNNPIITELSQFLKTIDCDIFLPILNNKKLIGYITVQEDKTQTIYNLDQQNKMIVLAQFLAPAIHLLQHSNLYLMLQETKEIKEELYAKHQEINQYKESIKKLLKDRVENHIGVIFFKNKHFSFKNAEAQTLLGINPNLQPSHPTSATLTNFARQIDRFQTAQTTHMTIHNGSKLIISGMPHAETSGGVLLIIRNPEATDIIKMQLDALKDPSKRDYLLYLETTKAGQLINKLLPSNHETILNTKIQLLEAALQKNALLLEMHHDDINPVVEVIHQLSGKETLHILTLQQGQQECGLKLFGINPLLSHERDIALLEKHSTGTLLIKNIELLDITSQQKLAYFIRYGIYTPLKSEQRKFSCARIICSTSHKLSTLLQDGLIIPELYHELHRNSQNSIIRLPSLVTMDHQELSVIIDGFMYQNAQEAGNKSLMPLNYKEKDALIEKRIPSIFEFKQKIQTLMMMKSTEARISQEEKLSNPKMFDTLCPELQLATQLGKHALKDIQLMTSLWKKLGSQTKIADLLGVNRSSVNRRCKDFNLI